MTSKITTDLLNFISDNLIADEIEIKTTDSLTDDLGLDSFSLIEIVLFIERHFGVQLPDEALTDHNLHSVETLTHCILQYKEEAS